MILRGRSFCFTLICGRGKPGDKHVGKSVQKPLAGHPSNIGTVANDLAKMTPAMRYAFRSFDRQWIIPDARLINQPNPTLWNAYSDRQVYLTCLKRVSPTSGPAVTLTGLIPDLDHYKGSFGGRVFFLCEMLRLPCRTSNPRC